MIHDPLCPYREGPKWDDFCPMCRLIAKVRESAFRSGYEAAMEDGWGDKAHIRAALDAAVQRVEATWASSWCGLGYATCTDPDHACRYRREVISAIKGEDL